jgi:hypothetical protein
MPTDNLAARLEHQARVEMGLTPPPRSPPRERDEPPWDPAAKTPTQYYDDIKKETEVHLRFKVGVFLGLLPILFLRSLHDLYLVHRPLSRENELVPLLASEIQPPLTIFLRVHL